MAVEYVKTILLVEDDPADAQLIQHAFAKVKIAPEIIRLTNGDEAVAYLDGRPPYEDRAAHPLPALLLLDLKLPRRTGLEVLQWLRARQDALGRLPAIMLTSSRQSTDVNQAYELGVNSYLAKPETAEDLALLATAVKTYWLDLNEEPVLVGTRSHVR